jgi:uncharacterized damage-inducible protein DinB
MTETRALRLESSEYAPYYGKYIETIGDQDVTSLLASQATALDALADLSDEKATYRYGPDKWSVKEVIGHLTDSERIFACRMLRVARGDTTPLPGFEQQPYVEAAHFDVIPIATLVEGFRTARASTLSLMSQIDDDGWPRMGTASGFPVSARALAYIIAGHSAHHIAILRDRYALKIQ